jgi:hypothetical protein
MHRSLYHYATIGLRISGQQNFLLKRDLDQASNDNDPAFTTSKAA